MKGRIKPFELSLAIGVIIAVLYGISAAGMQQDISDKIIRLHVVANSDSETDQNLKLSVRDGVLLKLSQMGISDNDGGIPVAKEKILNGLSELESAASSVVREHGYDYPVRVYLADNEEFPTRDYPGFSLPAGSYTALRVDIGAAEGKNWWCVIFPSLCVPSGDELYSAAKAASLTDEEVLFLTSDTVNIKLKFKILELLKRFK